MSKFKLEIKWAFIFIASILLWSLLENLLGFHGEKIDQHATFSMFFMVPAILVYFLALREKKTKYYNGNMSFSQGFQAGVWITIIVTIINPLTQWIISFVIAPEYFENVINYSVEQNLSTLEDAQAYFNYKSYIIQGSVGALIMGVITSLILAFALKSRKISTES